MSSKTSSKATRAAPTAIAAAVLAMVMAVAPAAAHHCGPQGAHAKDGTCLKKIKASGRSTQAGQATGKRQHKPIRMRMYYDQ